MPVLSPVRYIGASTISQRNGAGLPVAVAAYGPAVILILWAVALLSGADAVGTDNDDVMRLVQVRDLLAGQGWFDMTQYRLGLAGGTAMHWSRLVDAPIAGLILIFRSVMPASQAEAAALAIWPLSLVFPLLAAMGLAGWRIGGNAGMHFALSFTALLILGSNRFSPGAIDHHNVQLTLVAIMLAGLADPLRKPSSLAATGAAMALAIAIGAETVPFVAVGCLCIAGLWWWHGERFARAAIAFGLSLITVITAAFFATVGPSSYAMVTCDSLSLGFYGIATTGCAMLIASALLASGLSRPKRLVVLAVNAIVVLSTIRVLAPQCLASPLADLDPMLVELWLRGVAEAFSFNQQLVYEPYSIGSFYAAGIFAAAVCLFRIVQRQRVEMHLILLLLVLTSWSISLVQIRGAIFANLVSILPLALLGTDLRRSTKADPSHKGIALTYGLTVLASVPLFWSFGGEMAGHGLDRIVKPSLAGRTASASFPASCGTREAVSPLAGLPAGVVASASDYGAEILRFTPHRVLSGPYHRNQAGMLTELHIGLTKSAEAQAFLRGAGVTIVAFCAGDLQTRLLTTIKKDGLYADLSRHIVPGYLEPMPQAEDAAMRIFLVKY